MQVDTKLFPSGALPFEIEAKDLVKRLACIYIKFSTLRMRLIDPCAPIVQQSTFKLENAQHECECIDTNHLRKMDGWMNS